MFHWLALAASRAESSRLALTPGPMLSSAWSAGKVGMDSLTSGPQQRHLMAAQIDSSLAFARIGARGY